MNTAERSLTVAVPGGVELHADVALPASPRGVVVFAHGSGSSRHSRRNRYVARALQSAGLATVLADLLTADEERADAVTGELRFDIPRLSERVIALTGWAQGYDRIGGLGVGLFGASTGAAAALIAAAARPQLVKAVVSRGGRPDLAGEALPAVRSPTLLVVGGEDEVVLDLNRQAVDKIPGEGRLVVVPGAGHLFEEPGALEHVATLAREWFEAHLPARPSAPAASSPS